MIMLISPPASSFKLDDVSAEATLSSKGRTFHWARRFLTAEHAQRATRLYSLCRQLDDLADESDGSCDARQTFDLVHAGLTQSGPGSGLVADTDRLLANLRFELDPIVLQALIDGLSADLSPVAIDSEAALLRYAYRVAGTVGLMMCRAMDVTDPRAHYFAIDLGIAMQLTNICRDVREDAERGRRYLPGSLLGDCTAKQLICPELALQSRVTAAVEAVLMLADQYYRSGERGLVYLPQRARLAIAVAARVYRAIGTELRAEGCRYWLRRAVVPRIEKTRLTVQTIFTTELLSSPWVRTPHHDQTLHTALAGLPYIDSGGAP